MADIIIWNDETGTMEVYADPPEATSGGDDSSSDDSSGDGTSIVEIWQDPEETEAPFRAFCFHHA